MKRTAITIVVIMLIVAGCHRAAVSEETELPDTDLMDVYHIPYHIEYDESGIDYSQYVIENEEDFVKWNDTDLAIRPVVSRRGFGAIRNDALYAD